MQFKLPTDTNARGAGTTSEQQTVQKSAEANAHKIENNKLTAENNELKAELEAVKRELRRAKIKIVMEEKAREQEAEKLQKANENLEAAKKKIASVEEANSDWVLPFYTTEHQLWKANEEAISAQHARAALEKELEDMKIGQAALQTELEDTKRKLHEAVMEKKSSEVERTLLNSSLAIVKLQLRRVNDTLSACMAENDALKRQLSDQSATVETAVSQVVDKIAALDHSIEGRLSAFENSVNSTIGELHNGVQSNAELVEGLKLQLSEAKPPTGVLEATTAEESKQCAESSSEELEDQETSMPAFRGTRRVGWLVM